MRCLEIAESKRVQLLQFVQPSDEKLSRGKRHADKVIVLQTLHELDRITVAYEPLKKESKE